MASPLAHPRPPELLAPAGDWDALRAAVANGADSVYFGLDNFNARHRATNFTRDQLAAVMKYLHDHNVKGFLTFNTLIFSDELEQAADYVRAIAAAGVDAVIVQDLGLALLIRRMAPGLHIHGSTQMTLTEPRGIAFVESLGVERVVLARELSIEDVRKIRSAVDTPLEVFIHGALCVAYSGQCLTSESFGGRSANRGQCAQACRQPYDLIVDGTRMDLGDKSYLVSPQDLAAYDLVGDLASLGVASFKIEGRLKSAHYVAATCQTYRRAIDSWTSERPFEMSPQQRGDLEQTFSRGFTHGFLSGVNHQQLVPARFPKSRGRRIGTVARVTASGVVINVDRSAVPKNDRTSRSDGAAMELALKPGDGVVFDEGHPEQDEQGGRVFVVESRGTQQIEIELGYGDVNLAAVAAGAIVWKTDDPSLRRRLEHSFARDTVVRRTPVDIDVVARVGQKLSITFRVDDQAAWVEWDRPLEAASKFPISEGILRDQLGRLGDTPFELRSLSLDTHGQPMVPKSVLNDLRRQAVEQLMAMRERAIEIVEPGALRLLRARVLATGGEGRSADHKSEIADRRLESETSNLQSPISTAEPLPSPGAETTAAANAPAFYVLARTVEQIKAILNEPLDLRPAMLYADFEDVRRYKDAVALCRASNMPVALATLRVVKPGEDGLLQHILDCSPDAVVVRNLAAIAFYHEVAPTLPQIGDYALNIANELTADLMRQQNLLRMVPSYDLNWRQLESMLNRIDPSIFEVVVHQHMPMFHMEHCVFAATLSNGKDFRDCGRPCEKHAVSLRDHVGEVHPLIPDVGCRNTLFNARAQSAAEFIPKMRSMGVRHFRVELLRQPPAESIVIIRRYIDVLLGRKDPQRAVRSLRVLNQLGVTAGTLGHE